MKKCAINLAPICLNSWLSKYFGKFVRFSRRELCLKLFQIMMNLWTSVHEKWSLSGLALHFTPEIGQWWTDLPFQKWKIQKQTPHFSINILHRTRWPSTDLFSINILCRAEANWKGRPLKIPKALAFSNMKLHPCACLRVFQPFLYPNTFQLKGGFIQLLKLTMTKLKKWLFLLQYYLRKISRQSSIQTKKQSFLSMCLYIIICKESIFHKPLAQNVTY